MSPVCTLATARRSVEPLRNHEAIEAASACLRERKLPDDILADRIADRLDAMALALSMSEVPVLEVSEATS